MSIRIPENANPAERSAWLLIKSWERRGVLVQQAHLLERTN
jgi:hypothetical protein